MKSRYSTVLTVILVILIIFIIVILGIIGLKTYKSLTEEKETEQIVAEMSGKRPSKNEAEENDINDIENIDLVAPIQNSTPTDTTNTTTNEQQTPTRQPIPLYKNYPMIGTIKIPKINLEYPILLDVSPGALDTAIGVMYPVNPELNKKGNVVLIGHNYRNGKFFSNNKKLVTGDKIEITNLDKETLTYTIYEIFETTPQDTEYITRVRGENIEIALSTCTDDGDGRLVILARVE